MSYKLGGAADECLDSLTDELLALSQIDIREATAHLLESIGRVQIELDCTVE